MILNKFPDELISNTEKKKPDFGRKYASAIWSEWSDKISFRESHFEKLRSYADGRQDISTCKANMRGKFINEGFLRVDWNDKLNLLPRLLRRVWNGVDMKEFTPVIYAIDPTAREEKNNRKNRKLNLLYAKDFINEAAQFNGGMPIVPPDQIPESREQVEIEEQSGNPLSVEIGEELMIQSIASENHFNIIQHEALKEALKVGIGVVRIETDPMEGIKIEKVKPEYFIHSHTTNPYFSDCSYFGELKEITIAQAKRAALESGIDLNDEQLRLMATTPSGEPLNESATIRVLFYCFRTFFQDVAKKKTDRKTKSIRLIDRTEDVGTPKEYNPRYDSDKSEKIQQVYDVWFEGIMCLDNDRTIIRHRLVESMPEYKGKILPPYYAFAPRISAKGYNSIVEEVIPRIDALQELRYRILHLRNTLRGNLTEIDPDEIANITLGNQKLTPAQVLEFYFSLSVGFRRTKDDDGEPLNQSRSLQEIPTGIPHAVRELMSHFIQDVQLLNESFGYAGADQSRVDDKTLSDFEPYRLSDNLTMKDYTDTLYQWSVNVYRDISCRLNDVFRWSHLKDRYISIIGSDDVDVLQEYYNTRKNHYFDVQIDYVPTRQERSTMRQTINQYVMNGMIDPLDGEEILNVRNKKLGYRMLRLRIDARKKEAQKYEIDKVNAAQNGNIQAAQVSGDIKLRLMQTEYELKARQTEMDFHMKAELMKLQGMTDLQIEQVRTQTKSQIEAYRKEFEQQIAAFKKEQDRSLALDKTKLSAYYQSQMNKQRNGEIDTINLDGPTDTGAAPEVDLTQLNDYENTPA